MKRKKNNLMSMQKIVTWSDATCLLFFAFFAVTPAGNSFGGERTYSTVVAVDEVMAVVDCVSEMGCRYCM